MLHFVLAIGIAVCVVILLLRLHRGHNLKYPYPPGPRGDPLLGNVREMETEYSWLYYKRLTEKYGDVIHLCALGQHMIILNSHKAIHDVLTKNSLLFVNRPRLPMAGELLGWENGLVFSSGHRFNAMRKFANHYLGKAAVRKQFLPIIENAVHGLLKKSWESPEEFTKIVKSAILKIVLSTLYGIDADSSADDYLTLISDAAVIFGRATQPGAFLVDTFPILKYVPSWFPFAGFKRQAKTWAKVVRNSVELPFQKVECDLAAGIDNHSFSATILQKSEGNVDRNILKWLSGSLLAGSTDITSATVCTFLLAMVLRPEVQRKAQREIDSIIGTDRLPTLSDRERLPYVEAVFKETLRWQPIVPLAVPYLSGADFVCKGYLIPKVSYWGIFITQVSRLTSRDDTIYPNPEEFIPERFLGDLCPDAYTAHMSAALDPMTFAFGYGRRLCPGFHFSDVLVWLTIVSIFATTNIERLKDVNGHDIIPEAKYTGGMAREPLPFPYTLKPRSTTAQILVAGISDLLP
ncbi:cytochrome P450 [Cantharellus anzutake]|uniref:cytochrome P450 n=1 Tax=Cantharellus anzutake TaxID=1750568 RepID=UPI001908F641|nr:cytochrome P450 [Cantharellus anzutake]KAF8337893.1 cytochrome P450 [Cantharellus anzutake]